MKRYKVKVAVLALPRGRVVEGTVLDEEALLLGFLDPEEALAAMLARGVIEPVEEAQAEEAQAEEVQREPAQEEPAQEEPARGGKRKSR